MSLKASSIGSCCCKLSPPRISTVAAKVMSVGQPRLGHSCGEQRPPEFGQMNGYPWSESEGRTECWPRSFRHSPAHPVSSWRGQSKGAACGESPPDPLRCGPGGPEDQIPKPGAGGHSAHLLRSGLFPGQLAAYRFPAQHWVSLTSRPVQLLPRLLWAFLGPLC